MTTLHPWRILGSAFALLVAAACADAGEAGAGAEAGEAAEADAAPSLQELARARVTLSGLDSLSVQLEDGVATGPLGTRVTLLAAYSAEGDFDGDGTVETAALVSAEPGGSGVFMNLIAFRSGPDGPVQVTDKLLGDRPRIHRFEAVADSLQVELTTHRINDPMCCPSRRARQVFRIRDGVWRIWRDNTLTSPPSESGGDVRDPSPTPEGSGANRGDRVSA